jgi:DMSO reductase anchor subunit
MNPAPSVILFTALSGLGFGFLAFLSAGLVPVQGLHAFILWFVGYALAVGGLMLSAFHLGNPKQALRAFSQWRSSWLSREAVGAVITLLALAPMALSQWLGFGWPRIWGLVAALMCFATVFTTSMIYAQLKTIPRWNHWTTSALFLAYSAVGGAILAGQWRVAAIGLLALGALQICAWGIGDGRFAALGATMGTATGLESLGRLRVFEQPHTGENYLMREMIHVVGRRHAQKLRVIALVLAVGLPLALVVFTSKGPVTLLLATALHLAGVLAGRWLFFAQAEHVVGLYYGKR